VNAAIIVAAGRGTRMGKLDKVFLRIAGRPVVAYCWYALDQSPEIDQIVLVIRPELEDRFRAVARLYEFSKPFVLTPGGPERQDSVWNGLQALPPDTELVLIHDAARPCLTQELIHKTLTAAQEAGAAVAATPVVDTRSVRTMDRPASGSLPPLGRTDSADLSLCGDSESAGDRPRQGVDPD